MIELWNRPHFMPWKAKFAIRLSSLVNHSVPIDIEKELEERLASIRESLSTEFHADKDPEQRIRKHVEVKLCDLESLSNDPIKRQALINRIEKLRGSLARLHDIEFPLIPITDALIDEGLNSAGDPPLAVLFKRVGSGGQTLSNEDYIFAVIKHHAPATHGLVEDLMKDKRIASLFTPNALVMSAVRMTLCKLRNASDAAKNAFTDRAKMDKSAFANLVRKEDRFLDTFEALIQPDGDFSSLLRNVLESVSYSRNDFSQGLPRHALEWLVDPSLLDVVLAWSFRVDGDIKNFRLKIVRFLLWGRLCIGDRVRASERCIRKLDEQTHSPDFPDQILMSHLITSQIASSLPSPEELCAANFKSCVFSEGLADGKDKKLRGWSRFDFKNSDQQERNVVEVYKRWWNLRGNGYYHPFLLWLQRELVFERFEEIGVFAGMEEECGIAW